MKRTNRGFPIQIPPNEPSVACVYKVFFGKKYLIWKGKALWQSCELLGKSISAALSKYEAIEDTNYLYHVIAHIKKTRCLFGRVEVIANDFTDAYGSIDGLSCLKQEQISLDEAEGNYLCLNNNVQAYIPQNSTWITDIDKQRFLTWFKRKHR